MILARAILTLALIVCLPFVLALTAAVSWHDWQERR